MSQSGVTLGACFPARRKTLSRIFISAEDHKVPGNFISVRKNKIAVFRIDKFSMATLRKQNKMSPNWLHLTH